MFTDRQQLYVGSVVEKATKKRRLFVISGYYPDRESFLVDLKKELICHEDYDLRTIRWYVDVTHYEPIVSILHYEDGLEDLAVMK